MKKYNSCQKKGGKVVSGRRESGGEMEGKICKIYANVCKINI